MAIPATRPRPARKDEKPRTYPSGRVCSRDGCETVLSIYTKGQRCSLHGRRQRITRDEQRDALELLAALMQVDL